jgi:hypothetical protein
MEVGDIKRIIKEGEKLQVSADNQDFVLSYRVVGEDTPPFSEKSEGWRSYVFNYRVSVVKKCKSGDKKTSFMFYGSIADYERGDKEMTAYDLLMAFSCFLQDGLCSENGFREFCAEFGYDEDSIRALKMFNECVKSGKKARKLNIDAPAILDELR